MSRKINRPKQPENFYKLNRHPSFSRRKLGIEVQTYGWSVTGAGLTAGVYFIPQLTHKWVYRVMRHWLRWRRWYDSRPWHPQEYLSKCAKLSNTPEFTLGIYGAHTIDAREVTICVKNSQTLGDK